MGRKHVDTADIRSYLMTGEPIPPDLVADLVDDLERTRLDLLDLLALADRVRHRRGHGDSIKPKVMRTQRETDQEAADEGNDRDDR